MKHILVVLLWVISSFAQQETIHVWQDEIPGSINDPDYKMEIVFTDQNVPRIYHVTDPTLDIYLATQAKAPSTAIIICPGGGYSRLAADKEGHDISLWLNKNGMSAFVLKYRLPSSKIMKDKSIGPLQDIQEAMRIVRQNAEKWNIDPHKIGVMGFSAGGHLASTIATHFNEKVYHAKEAVSARPDFSILIYPVISMDTTITHKGSRDNLLGENASEELSRKFSNELQVSTTTPPTFLVHAMDDRAVPVENSIKYALALKNFSVPAELHIFEKGGHGFGMAVNSETTESNWPELCLKWLKIRGF